MSLIYWWPFTDNTVDKINGKMFTSTNWSFQSNGKIGKCFAPSWTDSNTISRQIYADNVSIPETFSVAVWVKNNNNFNSPRTYCPIQFSNGDCWISGANNKGWDFSHNSLRLIFNNGSNVSGSAGNAEVNWGYNPREFLGNWYHIVFTVNKTTRKAELFINGVSKGIKDLPSAVDTYGGTFKLKINWVQGWMLDGSLNDLRIYDHALSQAEAKELSKALVVHYSFNDVLAEPTTNIITGIKSAYGKSSLYGNGVKVDWSAGGADSYFMFNYSQAITANSIYTLSFDCEGLKSGEVATFAVSNLSAASYNIALKNGRNSLTFTAGADLMNDINTHSRLFFDDKNQTNGAVFYLSNFQLEEKDHATPYTPSTRASMIIDESGYDHPTVLVNNCEFVTDTNSGTLALHTAGADNTASFGACSYLRADMKTSITPTAFTISMWAKINTWGKQTSGVLSLNTSTDPTDYLTSTFVQYDWNFRLNNSASTAQSYISSGIVTLGVWHHYAFTWDGTNLKGYKDGALYSTAAAAFTPDPFQYVFLGVDRAGGAVRDADVTWGNFKVYMTALSAEEIAVESKARALITDKGDMETHQFIEGCANLQITYNGCTETYDIQEIGNAEYEQLDYIASTGTQYIDTGVYWTSEKATIVADLMVTTWKASSTIFGSEERYSGSSRYFAHILHAGSANGNYANYIGTGSIGNTTLTKDTRSVIEYIAHGNKKVTTRVTANGTTTTYINNQAYSGTILTRQNSTQTAANRGNIYIFANHNAYNGTAGIQNMAAMRLYRFTMIQDDIYIRDFIPCRRKSDSKVGLFDLVTGQFYTSPVGNFTAGNVVSNEDMQVQFISGNSIQARQIIEL